MLLKDDFRSRSVSSAVALCLLLSAAGRAQQTSRAPEQEEEVVRITSELVQTDVAVFDKRGRFVDDLRPEQFELQVEGKTQAVTFFERVRAGSRSEAAQLSAARARVPAPDRTAEPNLAAVNEPAGRLLFFFVDDLHLSSASMGRARTALQRYVTGGRAIFNSDSIEESVRQAISETADYYLLAWRPDAPELREAGARLKVSVKGHPEWRVRLRAASFNVPAVVGEQPGQPARTPTARAARAGATGNVVEPEGAAEVSKAAEAKSDGREKSDDHELLAALGSLYPHKGLPVALSVGYMDSGEQGTVLNVSMQLGRAAFDFRAADAKGKALVDVAGAAIDDRGRFGSFKQLLTVTPDAAHGDSSQPVIWHQRLRLKPGLYQVRIALRDRATGRTGSAMQWVEIPDLSKGDFALSSIFLGERSPQAAAERESSGPRTVAVDVDRRFVRSSVLRFQTYVYNAARASGGVQLQAQVFRGSTPLINTRPFEVPLAADPARLPFWSELALEQLPPGHYVLRLTATERTTNRTAVEQVGFYVE